MSTFSTRRELVAGFDPKLRVDRARRELEERTSGKGFFQQVQDSLISESLMMPILFSAQRGLGPSTPNDPGFNLASADQENYRNITEGLPPEYVEDLIAKSQSLDDAVIRSGQYREYVRAREGLHPVARIGAGLLDPAALAVGVVTGGVGAAAAKSFAASRATSLIAGGMTSIAADAPLEFLRMEEDPEAGALGFALATTMSFGAGTLGGHIATGGRITPRFRRAQKRAEQSSLAYAMGASAAGEFDPASLRRQLDEALSEKGKRYFSELETPEAKAEVRDSVVDSLGLDPEDAEALKAGDPDEVIRELTPTDDGGRFGIGDDEQPGDQLKLFDTGEGDESIGARAIQRKPRLAGDYGTEGVNDSAGTLTKLRFGLTGRVLASASSHARWLVRSFADDALRAADGGTTSTPATFWVEMQHDVGMSRLRREMLGSYRDYQREMVDQGRDALSFDEFKRDLTFARRSGQSFGPASERALKAIDRAFADPLGAAQRHGVPGLVEIEHSATYVPRLPRAERVDRLVREFGEDDVQRLIAASIEQGTDDMDAETAMRIAKGYLRTIRGLKDNPIKASMAVQGQRADSLELIIREQLQAEGIENTDQIVRDIMFRFADSPDEGRLRYAKHRVRMAEDVAIETTDGRATIQFGDLFEDDIEELADVYMRSVYGESAAQTIYRDFAKRIDPDGNRTFSNFESMREAIAASMREAGDSESMIATNLERLTALDKIIRATPIEPTSSTSRLLRQLRGLTYLRFSGGFGPAQIPEIGFVVAEAGLTSTFRQMPALRGIFGNARTGQLDNVFLRDLEAAFAPGTERLRNRISARRDFEESTFTLERGSGADQTLRKAQKYASDISGLSHIDAFLRRSMAASATQRFVDMAQGGRRLSAKRLVSMGLTEQEADKVLEAIRHELAKAPDEAGVVVEPGIIGRRVARFRPEQFTDQQAAATLIDSLNRWTRRAVLKPDAGNLALWMHKEWGKTLTQFQRFHLAAWEKHLLYGIQQFDGTALATFLISGFSGGLVWAGQQYVRSLTSPDGEKMREELTIGRIARAGAQRAGMTSFLPQIVDTVAYTAGYDPVFNARNTQPGGQGIPFFTVNPLFATITDIEAATRGIASSALQGDDDFTQRDVKRLLNLAPGKNIIGVSNLFDLIASPLPEDDQ